VGVAWLDTASVFVWFTSALSEGWGLQAANTKLRAAKYTALKDDFSIISGFLCRKLNKGKLLQFSFFVGNAFSGYGIKFGNFQFSTHSTLIFSGYVKVAGSRRRF